MLSIERDASRMTVATTSLTKHYPFLMQIQRLAESLCQNADDIDEAYESLMQQSANYEASFLRDIFRATLASAVADKTLTTSPPSYSVAIQYLMKAASYTCTLGYSYSERMELPLLRADSSVVYGDLLKDEDPSTTPAFILLLTYLSKLAYCWIQVGNNMEAIDWLQEIDWLYKTHAEHTAKSALPWAVHHEIKFHEFSEIGVLYRRRLSDVLCSLGNTAAAAHTALDVSFFCVKIITSDKIEDSEDLVEYKKLMKLCHPDFKTTANAEVVDAELQVRGYWNRIYAMKGRKPQPRVAFSSWIWRSRLYICGGKTHGTVSEFCKDLWYLDLRTIKWRELSSSPLGKCNLPLPIAEIKICLWNDSAWLFLGQLVLLRFQLVEEEWKYVHTNWHSKEPWPYTKNISVDFSAEIFEGVLHIFGGNNGYDSAGMNLHMSLDLRTLQWTKLGGSTDPEQLIKGMPLMRKGAASWVVPEERRMFILYGFASPRRIRSCQKDSQDYQHDDMWSYSFDELTWRRERFRGNFPCPRASMACAYDPKLQRVVVFGGADLYLPTIDEQYSHKYIPHTPLADTLVLDMKTRIWKQVLTRNFPHHRFGTLVSVDEESGKIYLYAGICPTVYMPAKNTNVAESFVCLGDLWQLDVEHSGAEIARKDCLTDREEIYRFGPWKLCFGCRSYKSDMFACGGTCGGRIFLCSTDCQRKCWKDHKCIHCCQKF